MRILFITRKYPPSVGGMENVSYSLAQALNKEAPTTVIAWGKSQKYLPYFYIKAFVQAIWLIPTKRITHIYLGDAVLSPLGLMIKLITRKPATITVHGLDITFGNQAYQLVIPKCVAHMDHIICISQATLSECTKRNVPAEKCTVIGWGVEPGDFASTATRLDLAKFIHHTVGKNIKILVTVGRLVPRKGVHWFVTQVMPKLSSDYIYLVVGEGSDRSRIEAAIEAQSLRDRVLLLGRISDRDRAMIYNTADIFVMPNIPVKGDMEGFGIVALEASSAGLPVVASNLEGIRDALATEPSSQLFTAHDSNDCLQAINEARGLTRRRIAPAKHKKSLWTNISRAYMSVMEASK